MVSLLMNAGVGASADVGGDMGEDKDNGGGEEDEEDDDVDCCINGVGVRFRPSKQFVF